MTYDSLESFSDSLQNFQTFWKVSGQSKKFPDSKICQRSEEER